MDLAYKEAQSWLQFNLEAACAACFSTLTEHRSMSQSDSELQVVAKQISCAVKHSDSMSLSIRSSSCILQPAATNGQDFGAVLLEVDQSHTTSMSSGGYLGRACATSWSSYRGSFDLIWAA